MRGAPRGHEEDGREAVNEQSTGQDGALPTKSCFVIMPIGKVGTEDHGHFRALYENVIKPVMEAAGYNVVRADDIQRGGAITQQIVVRLAQADLVVADMTDLNPNVFYELGVRHSLRAAGTLMIIDESRTDAIPFDLDAYRVIRFAGTLEGLGKIRTELLGFVRASEQPDADLADNPIHNWLPALPSNVVDTSAGSAEGVLRSQIRTLRERLATYERRYGLAKTSEGSGPSPLNVVSAALDDAREGSLPSDLLERAAEAAAKRDKVTFLAVLRRVMEAPAFSFTGRQYVELASHAANLGLDAVEGAVFEVGVSQHPTDDELRLAYLGFVAHSADPANRERARTDLQREIGITVTGNQVTLPPELPRQKIRLIGLMLDAYGLDGLSTQALAITAAAVERFPEESVVLRNHARALEQVGDPRQALEFYRRALLVPSADDTSATWLGNELHNRERHVDAIESYLRACLYDPDDANGFAHVAQETAIVLKRSGRPALKHKDDRALPTDIDATVVEGAIIAALSAPLLDERDLGRCREAAITVEIPMVPLPLASPVGRQARLAFASALYERVRSDLTAPSD